MPEVSPKPDDIPFAHARPTGTKRIDDESLQRLVSVARTSAAQFFRGPCFFAADGTPCILIVAHDLRPLRHIREAGEFGLLAWRWNVSPSAFVSFTLMTADGQSLLYSFELTDPVYLAAPLRGEMRWLYRPNVDFQLVACDPEATRSFSTTDRCFR
jgi:hypothetical protein